MNNLILVVNKDKNITSRDVVNKLSKILNIKKIGHTGTLDPLASGVLVCVTNKYTKLVDLMTSLDKEYIATIKLGISTDTLDITGNVLNEEEPKKLNREDIIKVLDSFKKEYVQVVPKYSAKSVNGKRLYEYARNNEDIELPKVLVNIKEIELLDYHDDLIKIRCLVSKGTYIRSLIKDICDELHVLGCMSDLIRTKQGSFNIDNSYRLEDIENNNYKSLDIKDVLDIKEVNLTEDLYKKVINGNILELDYDGYILFIKSNNYVALYEFNNKAGRLKILF